jgi:hypothetical protein
MVVLADEILESFYETDLSASFKLETVPGIELPESSTGLLGGLWSAVATEDNKKMFNRLTDEFGKTIGKHQVINKPSIGRYTGLEEPKARESLLTPGMRKSPSKSILTATESTLSVGSSSTSNATTTTSSSILPRQGDKPATPTKAVSTTPPSATVGSPTSPELPILQAANAALMERTAFAIDDAGDDDESDSELEGGEDDEVMDEVDAFLEAHESGLSEADKALAKGSYLHIVIMMLANACTVRFTQSSAHEVTGDTTLGGVLDRPTTEICSNMHFTYINSPLQAYIPPIYGCGCKLRNQDKTTCTSI